MTCGEAAPSLPGGPVAAVEGLVLGESGEVRLRGTRCGACGEWHYPARRICPNCSRDDLEAVEFGPAGVLYSFTVLREPPAAPPRPFGQVEFEGRVRVQGMLLADPAAARVGASARLVPRPVGRDEQGRDLIAFGFQIA